MLKWLLAIVILAVVSGLGSGLSPRRWRFSSRTTSQAFGCS